MAMPIRFAIAATILRSRALKAVVRFEIHVDHLLAILHSCQEIGSARDRWPLRFLGRLVNREPSEVERVCQCNIEVREAVVAPFAHLARSQDGSLGAAEHLRHDVLRGSLSARREAVDAKVGTDDVHQSTPCLRNALKINSRNATRRLLDR
jgi:hypothetical protein